MKLGLPPGSAPAADDITPVLIYVILHVGCLVVDDLQANPASLLSNIEYIRGFYESRMTGREQYWWTQFTSAVEYIKSLLHRE